jgi:hypothetical protein
MAADWVLGLEQNADRKVVSGSPGELAAAVRRGADLRLYLTTEHYEETLYFQQTYAGGGDAFAGLMTHHHSLAHRGKIAEQPYFCLFKYDLSGRFSLLKWMLDHRTLDESADYPYGVYRWFYCDRWRPVYVHDAGGQPLFGDLEELKELVRQGRTLQVGIRQLFGLGSDDRRGPEHISFVSTMQPVIQDGQVLSNCDLVLAGPPRWPFTWKDGLHLCVMRPSTSGEIECYLTEPGRLPFRWKAPRRGMQWMVAERV